MSPNRQRPRNIRARSPSTKIPRSTSECAARAQNAAASVSMEFAKNNTFVETTVFHRLILLIVGLGLILLTACAEVPSATVVQSTSIPNISTPSMSTTSTASIQVPASGVKQAGDLRVWIITNPSPPKAGNCTLDAYVIDSKGQPVSDAKLTFDLNMTNMNMGRNTVTPTLLGEGHYTSQVFFSMRGPWRVIITIVHAGQTNTTQFDFTVF